MFVGLPPAGFKSLRGWLLLAGLTALLSCTHLPEGNAVPGRQPPPKPGSSISHTQMCRCISCMDPACCTREAESEQSETCKEVDGKIECGLEMKSCGRCQEVMWRISASKDCGKTQPKDCCKRVAVRR